MNRLPGAFRVDRPEIRDQELATSTIDSSPSEATEAFFMPQHYEASYQYPLVIWLHDSACDATQLNSILPGISSRNFVGAAVGGFGTSAQDTVWRGLPPVHAKSAWPQTPGHIETAEDRIAALIANARSHFQCDTNRIFIAGHGDGGTMALRMALSHPQDFMGVISIGGGLPQGHSPLRSLNRARQLPVFLASGAVSSSYQADDVCRDLRLLHTAGVSVTLRNYPCGDEVHDQCLADTNTWMMDCLAQISGASIII